MKQGKGHQLDSHLLECLIQMGLRDEAFDLMDSSELKVKDENKWVVGAYLNILADKQIDKADAIVRDLEVDEIPRPADLFDIKLVEQEGLTEEDCLQRLVEGAMPEKKKEMKTTNVA